MSRDFELNLSRGLNVTDREQNNVLKPVIFSLKVGFTGDFVHDCPLKLHFW